mgnify:CR=1 FL=1
MDMNMLTQFSFYFGAASMLCASVFFFFERAEVAAKWRTSVTVAGLVTFIALVGLFMPLKSAIVDNRMLSIIRVSLMILSGIVAIITFVKSFIQARKNK